MNDDIFNKAQEILKNRRLRAESENEARIREVNDKLPQIREINEVIHNTARELISIISSRPGADISGKIEQLKRNNLEAQAMTRRLLAAGGYPEDYLEMHYKCPKCSDTGYIGDIYCNCFHELCGRLAAEKMNRNAQLNLSSFDTFSMKYYKDDEIPVMKRILDFSVDYANSFTTSSPSIFMFGRTGLGKTHISLAIANVVLSKGYSVIYDSVINILRSIEREHFSRDHSTETADLVMDTDLLILDDLGTEYETQFYNATVYNIINTRLNRGKPTIISTNLDFAGIGRRYDERVVSRIVSAYKCFEFKGEDVRLQKRRNEDAERAEVRR